MEQTSSEPGDNSTGHKLHETENKVLDILAEFLHWFEVGLAALSVVFVGLGVLFLLDELTHFSVTLQETTLHASFEEVLSDVLLLVVGIELALMLVRRTPEALIEVMFFVVARKMLIKADTFWDLILGVAALAGLFAIRKYLEHAPAQGRGRVPRIPFGRGKKKQDDEAAAEGPAGD
jgi:hypothetical protein